MKVRLALKILLSLAFIALIAFSLRAQNPWEYLRKIQTGPALISVLVSLAMVSVSCWKWKLLLELELAAVPFRRLLRFYFIGYYYTVLLPSNVGGDFMRSYLTGREVGSQSKAAVSVFLERVSGFIVLLLLACTTPLLMPGLVKKPAVLVPVALALVLLLGLIGCLALPAPSTWLPGWFSRILPGWHDSAPRGRLARLAHRLLHAMEKIRTRLFSALRELGTSPGGKLGVTLLTALFYLLTWVNVWISFRAFGVEVSFREVVAVMPVCMLIVSLPVAPFAGLGLSEGAYLFFFGLLGVAGPATLAMAVFLRLKLILLGTAGMLCQLPDTSRESYPP